jgi:hypothetical protein
MTAQEFDKILELRIKKIRDVLATKANEYASYDRLHNFKAQPGIETKETPEQVLWGYLRKHLQSIYDMVTGSKEAKASLVDEKLGDAINYLILLEAIFIEQWRESHGVLSIPG